jgi:hypothetical protein
VPLLLSWGVASPAARACAKITRDLRGGEAMDTSRAAAATQEQLTLVLHDARREAAQAAGFVAAFVGVPAFLAAGTVLFMFALTLVVLLAPVAALALTWVAWRYGRSVPAAR